jgi:hypothetical protein
LPFEFPVVDNEHWQVLPYHHNLLGNTVHNA